MMDTPPPGYTPPIAVYLVQVPNEAGEVSQIAGFFIEGQAEEVLDTLTQEGLHAHINVVPIHHRVEDYEWDR
jgi:hypothetical protein